MEVVTAPAVAPEARRITLAPVERAARPSRPRSLPLWTGRAVMATGLLLVLFVLFEVAGTALLEQRQQASLLPAFQAAVTTTALDRPAATPADGTPVALLEVPRIGLQEVVVQGTSPGLLKSGPGHLDASPMPGEFGNAVVAGHRETYGGPFRQLDRLGRGDVIRALTGQGYFTYRVRSVSAVRDGQADPIVATRDSRLTLLTSAPAFVASQRLVVVAMLQGRPVAVDRRAPALVGATDLGLAGDPVGLGTGIIWTELLLAAGWFAWRMRRRWPARVVWLLAAPTCLALALLAFTSFDLLLPGTL